MKPTILAYNLSGERARKVQWLAMRSSIKMRQVAPQEYEHLIGDLVSGELPERKAYEGEGFPEEMMVMAHFPLSLVNRFLDSFRQSGMPPVRLKCLLTETNSEWTSLALHNELKDEAAYFAKMRAYAHEKRQRQAAGEVASDSGESHPE